MRQLNEHEVHISAITADVRQRSIYPVRFILILFYVQIPDFTVKGTFRDT